MAAGETDQEEGAEAQALDTVLGFCQQRKNLHRHTQELRKLEQWLSPRTAHLDKRAWLRVPGAIYAARQYDTNASMFEVVSSVPDIDGSDTDFRWRVSYKFMDTVVLAPSISRYLGFEDLDYENKDDLFHIPRLWYQHNFFCEETEFDGIRFVYLGSVNLSTYFSFGRMDGYFSLRHVNHREYFPVLGEEVLQFLPNINPRILAHAVEKRMERESRGFVRTERFKLEGDWEKYITELCIPLV